MAGQTTIDESRNQQDAESPAAGVGRNLAGLGHDLISLAELQVQLTACDVREGAAKGGMAVAFLGGAVVVALGAVPVLIAAVGLMIAELTSLPIYASLFIICGVAFLLAAGAAWWGWNRAKTAISTFSRTRQELVENINWIKRTLLQQSRSQNGQHRSN